MAKNRDNYKRLDSLTPMKNGKKDKIKRSIYIK